jgi:hypothetical protein
MTPQRHKWHRNIPIIQQALFRAIQKEFANHQSQLQPHPKSPSTPFYSNHNQQILESVKTQPQNSPSNTEPSAERSQPSRTTQESEILSFYRQWWKNSIK